MKALLLVFLSLAGTALAVEADARRGAALFTEHKCTTCHSISGAASSVEGPARAPDLGLRADREYTPASLASRMWNHAPQMWSAMQTAGIEPPKLSETDAADLFAFFYAKRFFEKRGDAARGKQVFVNRNCVDCHIAERLAPSKWKSLGDPIDFIQRMWNHAPEMRRTNAAYDNKWPQLTADEMTDMLVYLQNLPGSESRVLTLALPAGTRGKELMDSRGCTKCHQGVLALDRRLHQQTLTQIAAAMWNHAPTMREVAQTVTADEMREIIAYSWATGFFGARGDASKGGKMFDKRCGSCHNQHASGAPDLKSAKRPFTSITLMSGLWRHGPQMLAKIEGDKKPWPLLSPKDVANLIAFLDSGAK